MLELEETSQRFMKNKSTYSNSLVLKMLVVGCVLLTKAGALASGANLTGSWRCDDGGIYQIREIQNGNVAEVFRYGKGNGWQNVFHGICKSTDTSSDFSGRWADAPPFGNSNEGTIIVRVQGGDRLIMVGNPAIFSDERGLVEETDILLMAKESTTPAFGCSFSGLFSILADKLSIESLLRIRMATLSECPPFRLNFYSEKMRYAPF